MGELLVFEDVYEECGQDDEETDCSARPIQKVRESTTHAAVTDIDSYRL